MQGTPCARVEEETYHSPLGGHGWGVGRERTREVEERNEVPLAEGQSMSETCTTVFNNATKLACSELLAQSLPELQVMGT